MTSSGTAGATPALITDQVTLQSGNGSDVTAPYRGADTLSTFESVLAPAPEVQQDQDPSVSSPPSSLIVKLKYGNILVPVYSSGADLHVGDLRTALDSPVFISSLLKAV